MYLNGPLLRLSFWLSQLSESYATQRAQITMSMYQSRSAMYYGVRLNGANDKWTAHRIIMHNIPSLLSPLLSLAGGSIQLQLLGYLGAKLT